MKNSPGYCESDQRTPQGPLVPYLATFEPCCTHTGVRADNGTPQSTARV
jgi:hypothetical protein